MATPADRKYSKEHEWVLLEPAGTALVGLSEFAQDQLGDVVYLDLPAVGSQAQQFQKIGEVESVKAVSDLYSPVSGEVLEVNQELASKPELVNQAPYDQGWLLRMRLADPSGLENLLDAAQYDAHVGGQ